MNLSREDNYMSLNNSDTKCRKITKEEDKDILMAGGTNSAQERRTIVD